MQRSMQGQVVCGTAGALPSHQSWCITNPRWFQISWVRQLACRRRDTHSTHMHKYTQVQESREGSFALAGFPTDQARATLEPDGHILNRWDGSFQCVRRLMAGTLWGRDEVYSELGNPSRLEYSPGDSGRSPGQLTYPTLHSGITPTLTHAPHDILVPLLVWGWELRGLPSSCIH